MVFRLNVLLLKSRHVSTVLLFMYSPPYYQLNMTPEFNRRTKGLLYKTGKRGNFGYIDALLTNLNSKKLFYKINWSIAISTQKGG